MSASLPSSIPAIVDVHVVRGAASDGTPDLVIDVPHGATATGDFELLAGQLTSPLPAGLVDFFYVNTDTGAPELALVLAERIIAAQPERTVVVFRCRIPRTFIDCNRRLDATPEEFKAGGVAPGLMPWIVTPEDRELLRARYDAYVGLVRATVDAMPAHGATLLMHTYAPRTVGVEVDFDIVARLHAAYEPEVVERWPTRPEMDVIGRDADGVLHAPAAVVDHLRRALAEAGMALGDSATYPLHPSTLGWDYVTRRPGRGLCLEVRRDLFVQRFEPFIEARIDPARVAALADLVAPALNRWW